MGGVGAASPSPSVEVLELIPMRRYCRESSSRASLFIRRSCVIDARTALDRVGDTFLLCRRTGEPVVEIGPVEPAECLADGDTVYDVCVSRVESADEIDPWCFWRWSRGPRTVDRRGLVVEALAGR